MTFVHAYSKQPVWMTATGWKALGELSLRCKQQHTDVLQKRKINSWTEFGDEVSIIIFRSKKSRERKKRQLLTPRKTKS